MTPRVVAIVGIAAACVAAFAGAPRAGAEAPLASRTWINTEPLRSEDLDGKVRLVEFWTFGCINCQRTFPAMNRLQADFARRGLVIVGVHTPEFEAEKKERSVRDAVAKVGIAFPVALDNDDAIWKSFGNRYWPALYLIDRDGRIRRAQVGELHIGTPEWSALVRDVETLLREPAS